MSDDLQRLRAEYDRRAADPTLRDLYEPTNPAELFLVQQRARHTAALLRRAGLTPLRDKRVLEVGCGAGGVLLNLGVLGAQQRHTHGVDLIGGRLPNAKARLPHAHIACADGQQLPYASASFDLVVQHTMFSSILDDAVKTAIAAEMLRVTRPGGAVLWYDFWLNPTNPQTKGIRRAEIRQLFPGTTIMWRTITLAPPIARRLIGLSWWACATLEALKVANTHILALLRV